MRKAVRRAIENDRKSVKKAKEARQQASEKEAVESTSRPFLSALARDKGTTNYRRRVESAEFII